MKAIRFERFVLAGALVLAVGCNEDTDDGGAGDTVGDDGGDGGDDGPMCQSCESCPNDLWGCWCEVAANEYTQAGCAGCYPNPLIGQSDCSDACSQFQGYEL